MLLTKDTFQDALRWNIFYPEPRFTDILSTDHPQHIVFQAFAILSYLQIRPTCKRIIQQNNWTRGFGFSYLVTANYQDLTGVTLKGLWRINDSQDLYFAINAQPRNNILTLTGNQFIVIPFDDITNTHELDANKQRLENLLPECVSNPLGISR